MPFSSHIKIDNALLQILSSENADKLMRLSKQIGKYKFFVWCYSACNDIP